MKELVGPQDYASFVDSFDTFLFDCDGVIWNGSHLLPGVKESLQYLRSKGKKLLFVTNNSAKSRKGYVEKFSKLNLEVQEGEIIGTAYIAALYLKQIISFPPEKKIYIIGETGIFEELSMAGIKVANSPNGDREPLESSDELGHLALDPDVGGVVVGIDLNMNYRKMAIAFAYLNRNPGSIFVLTNDDATYPVAGSLFPAAGTVAAPLVYALGRQPDAVLGKPAQTMMECLFEKFKFDKKRTCMVGDRLNTDIAFGKKGGVSTLLVLTGVATRKDAFSTTLDDAPDFLVDSLASLFAQAEKF